MDINITSKASHSYQYAPQWQHGPWTSAWFQVTTETVDVCLAFDTNINTDQGCSRTTYLKLPLAAAWAQTSPWFQVATQTMVIHMAFNGSWISTQTPIAAVMALKAEWTQTSSWTQVSAWATQINMAPGINMAHEHQIDTGYSIDHGHLCCLQS